MIPWIWIGACYLLGSVPFSYLVVRLTRGIDIRQVGSGNAGATNVLRTSGRLAAAVALTLDVAKGAVAAAGALSFDGSTALAGAAGVAAVVGHVFPVWLAFKGGKGVATSVGVYAVLAPWCLALGLVLFLIAVLATRFVSLGSLVLVSAVPLLMLLLDGLGWGPPLESGPWLAAAAIGLLVFWCHRGNIRRLLEGSESRLNDAGSASG